MPTIAEEIARISTYRENPPPNEACTCDWAVLPLLWASGYEHHDIWSRVSDNAGQFPDYTMLPNSAHMWFVEAKGWTTDLANDHAVQALNYANSKGRWWVVLTNGRVWRLYDNRIGGLPEARLVTEARLVEPGFEDFVAALGKASVTSGGLEKYALSMRIASVLQSELPSPDSRLIRTLRTALRSEFGLAGVMGSDLAEFFRAALAGSPVPAGSRGPDVPTPVTPALAAAGGEAVGLDVLTNNGSEQATGRKPRCVVLPDGSCRAVRSWRSAAFETITWFLEQQRMPALPFRGQEGGNRYFINREPIHANGDEMRSAQVLTVADQTIHVDTWRSAREIIRCLVALCVEVGVPAAGISVELGGDET